jgi:(p)ppGpp synthase/HD superfamily hydrolase
LTAINLIDKMGELQEYGGKMDEVLIHKAIQFAAVKHKGQNRKVTAVPYISHIMEVYGYLAQSGCSDNVLAAGILHDTIEDTATTAEEIEKIFGREICEIVACESEDKSKSWRERKQTTIDRLGDSPLAVKQVCCADKLSNLLSIYLDRRDIGEKIWERFKADRDQIRWYYDGIIKELTQLNGFEPYEKLKDYYKKVFSAECRTTNA